MPPHFHPIFLSLLFLGAVAVFGTYLEMRHKERSWRVNPPHRSIEDVEREAIASLGRRASGPVRQASPGRTP
jgi:hypothetical protein